MGGDVVGLFFYVPLERRPASDDELYERVGYDGRRNAFGPEVMVHHRIVVLDYHACVELYFLHASYIDMLPSKGEVAALEADPMLPLVHAIRDGAARAQADVAIFESHNYRFDDLADDYWMVFCNDVPSLARKWYSFLWVADHVVDWGRPAWWTPDEVARQRDLLLDGPGVGFFANRGADRWY